MAGKLKSNILAVAVCAALFQGFIVHNAKAQPGPGEPPRRGEPRATVEADPETEETSPVRRIRRGGPPQEAEINLALNRPSIDGVDNNLFDAAMNSAHEPLARWTEADYADGISALSGEERPGPREISNGVVAQETLLPNEENLSDFFWQWGQFLDHDIDLTDGVDPAEPANILIPPGDAEFDPEGTGAVELRFNRSVYDLVSTAGPRQQVNEITGWIDGSQVYGSDSGRAEALRTLDGTGRLRMSGRRLLPLDTPDQDNAGGRTRELFLAGDVRANEQIGLTAMHTLFVREHNRVVERMFELNPELTGEQLYQIARARVTAHLQIITYREFVPRLLGENALAPYAGYDPTVDARIMNSFSTGAFRFGHSLLSPQLLRLNADGSEHEAGHLALRDAFFAPGEIRQHGIDPVLRGLAAQVCQRLDAHIIDDVRNFLFGIPGAGGFDLAALNIQRGRDHGLPSYNAARIAAGLPPVRRFEDITRNRALRERLRDTYASPDLIDLWVGGLAEDHVPGAQVGPLFHRILARQFTALRDGDRFWYENRFSDRAIENLERTSLADIIRRNTGIDDELPDDVFVVTQGDN